MLSLNNLRVIWTSHGILRHSSNKLLANRQCLSKKCSSSSYHASPCNSSSITFNCTQGTRSHSNTGSFRPLLHESIYKKHTANQVRWSRTFCTASYVKLKCWKCKQPVEEKNPAFFCASCKVIQPSNEGASFFQIMDCDQAFALDTQKLQKRYLQLQRSLHPDNFSQKTVKEQEYSEHQSALVNKAYTTLLKPLSRGLYMLELKGIHLGEGTDTADPLFLLELMEINEALDEAQSQEDANNIGISMKEKLKDLTVQIDASLCKGELQAAKALLSKMKYIVNIEEKVKEKLSELM